MATKLFLRSTQNNGVGATYFDMGTAAGAGAATGVVNSAASGTEIQWTQSAGGAVLQFISGRAPAGGFTLTSTDISIWAAESNAQANAGGRYRVFKRTAAGVETELGGGPFNDGVEFGTSAAEMLWAGNVTDTAFAEDDRILLKLYITNVGTMGGARTCTLSYNGADAATGDSFLNIAETVSFKAESQSATLGTAAASDTPQPLARVEGRALAIAAATDGAQPLTRTQLAPLAVATSIAAAQLQARTEARTVGLSGATNTALTIMPMIGALGVAAANDNAVPLARAELELLGTTLTSDTTRPLAGAETRAIGAAVASDAAQALARTEAKALTAAPVAAAAQPLPAVEIKAIGAAIASETAQALGGVEPFTIGIAGETSAAASLAGSESLALAAAIEISGAMALAAAQSAGVGPATETTVGLAILAAEVRPIGFAATNDNALALAGSSGAPTAPVPASRTARIAGGSRRANVSTPVRTGWVNRCSRGQAA